MSAYPSLPLFTDAFIADTGHLSAQETGAYLMLMMVAWRSPECRLPDTDDKLARWARVDRRTWLRIKPAVMEFWTLADGFWSQKRLSKEREFVSKRAEVNRRNGEQGGRPKSLKNNDAENPVGYERVSETKAPTPTPNPKITPTDAIASSAPKGAGRQRGTRIPDGFEHSSEAREVAASFGLTGDAAAEALAEFADYWRALPGLKATKLDWPATFRNRLRDIGRRRPAPRASPPAGRSSPGSRLLDRMEARRAERYPESAQADHGPILDYEGDGGPYQQVHEPAGGQAGRFPSQAALRLVGSGRR
ncbi:YdaU family protein [Methylorubrum extorquens]|uniref:YdaU family protein n=1 Tax=Methylorubrum extorquens TaxID=408 RepID=UPI000A20FAC1|nr:MULTISPECIES: DUF1376 domain-containing protein [Methylorubrum]ARO57215.1 hypothetical protein B2G69_25690 [Methylorubrum zatmanii]